MVFIDQCWNKWCWNNTARLDWQKSLIHTNVQIPNPLLEAVITDRNLPAFHSIRSSVAPSCWMVAARTVSVHPPLISDQSSCHSLRRRDVSSRFPELIPETLVRWDSGPTPRPSSFRSAGEPAPRRVLTRLAPFDCYRGSWEPSTLRKWFYTLVLIWASPLRRVYRTLWLCWRHQTVTRFNQDLSSFVRFAFTEQL